MKSVIKLCGAISIIFAPLLLIFVGVYQPQPVAATTSGNISLYLPLAICADCPETTPAPSATASATSVPAATQTPIPATSTATIINDPPPTFTPRPPTLTPSNTPVAATPTATNTPVAATSTATNTPVSPATVTPSPTAVISLLTEWMINTTGETSAYMRDSNGNPHLVNVQSVEQTSNNNYSFVQASGIPSYSHTMSQSDINALNNRPRAHGDFTTGSTTASAGQTIGFGQDIGYISNESCTAGAGFGYWPPGPACPDNTNHQVSFPLNQQASTSACETGLGTIGLWVNGTAMFNWGDGFSYNGEGVWTNLAPVAEQYDVDICGGHAAGVTYHHHSHPSCLGEQLNDTGTAHSPIYGFAADGYPIYGPWEDNGTLAQSCWKTRDYDNANSATGCGVAGERSCLLVDEYDINRGTRPATAGPTTSDIVTTLSRNEIQATSGYYYEDYYYDSSCTSQGSAYLDQYNGHSDAQRGYHYHVTVVQNTDGTLSAVFPYTIGPRFYGQLQDDAATTCEDSSGGGPPPNLNRP